MAKDGSQRIGDVARVQEAGGHLVEERRKEVVVVLVEEGHADGLAVQLSCARQATETGADDGDFRGAATLAFFRRWGSGVIVHRSSPSTSSARLGAMSQRPQASH